MPYISVNVCIRIYPTETRLGRIFLRMIANDFWGDLIDVPAVTNSLLQGGDNDKKRQASQSLDELGSELGSPSQKESVASGALNLKNMTRHVQSKRPSLPASSPSASATMEAAGPQSSIPSGVLQ